MVKQTRVLLKSSLAVGMVLGLLFVAPYLFEVRNESASERPRPVGKPQATLSKTAVPPRVYPTPVIHASSNAFPGDDHFSPLYLVAEGKTIWHAQPPIEYPQWIEISFPEPVLLTQLGLRSQAAGPGGNEHRRAPKEFLFQGSQESDPPFPGSQNRKWTDLLSVEKNLFDHGGQWKDWAFENETAFRFYRIYITKGGDSHNLTIQQIRFDPGVRFLPPAPSVTAAPTTAAVPAPAVKRQSVVAKSSAAPRPRLSKPFVALGFNPVGVRKEYDELAQQADLKSKQEAMGFSLDLWEKRRKAYFA